MTNVLTQNEPVPQAALQPEHGAHASPGEGSTSLTEMEIEHGLPPGWGHGWSARALFWIAFVFSAFQIATAVYAILPTQTLRTMHVAFLVLVGGGLIANHKAPNAAWRVVGWAIAFAGFGVGLYHWIFYLDLVNRAGELTQLDFIVGIAALVILFAVSWVLMGAALPLICLAFLAYALLGQYLPAAVRPSRLRFRPGHRASVVRHRGHLRHADLRLGDLHLPLHPVRLVPRTRRHDPAVHRRFARPVRPDPRRTGQGGGVRLGLDGHDLRLGRRQCRHRRPVHDPADEALRLSAAPLPPASRPRRRWAGRSCRR